MDGCKGVPSHGATCGVQECSACCQQPTSWETLACMHGAPWCHAVLNVLLHATQPHGADLRRISSSSGFQGPFRTARVLTGRTAERDLEGASVAMLQLPSSNAPCSKRQQKKKVPPAHSASSAGTRRSLLAVHARHSLSRCLNHQAAGHCMSGRLSELFIATDRGCDAQHTFVKFVEVTCG